MPSRECSAESQPRKGIAAVVPAPGAAAIKEIAKSTARLLGLATAGLSSRLETPDMSVRTSIAIVVAALATTVMTDTRRVEGAAQTSQRTGWNERTLWGDPDLQGEWTAEGEFGVPFERPAQFGT